MQDDDLKAMERAIQVRSTWQYRAVEYTRSHTTIAGMILLAALNKQPTNPPFFIGAATITSDGMVYAEKFVDKQGRLWGEQPVNDIEVILNYFRKLADRLKFTEAEVAELFVALRQWIKIDRRN